MEKGSMNERRSESNLGKCTVLKCGWCGTIFSRKDNLTRHVKKGKCNFKKPDNNPDIEIKREKHTFANYEKFLEWKEKEEDKCFNRYMKHTGTKIRLAGEVDLYYCHRSGTYESQGKGQRSLKIQGSKKIGRNCPSRMTATKLENGQVTVNYIVTHVGHESDLCHLTLTPDERKVLASKISMKIPFDGILDEVRTSATLETGLKRLHLLTKKDLANIERCYNLCSCRGIRHENDAVSIQSYVNETDDVLFYKAQGQICEIHPELGLDDICLVIMNASQKLMFEKFGNECICLDSTHGVNSYGFELTTLLVLDELHQGFPCAFLLSNKTNEQFLSIFFNKIKERTSVVKPKVFMSDMAEAFYNAWLKVMEPAEYRLFCAWHVDNAWRKNINKKIKDFEDKKEVYKKLRVCLQESDSTKFHSLIGNLIQQMKSKPELLDFGNYFEATYSRNVKNWAYCYRLHVGLNTNMHLERMHRTLKYIYLRGKKNKRLDTCVFSLMNFVKDKCHETIRTINMGGKLTSKIIEIRKRHAVGVLIPSESIVYCDEENYWIVKSTDGKNYYTVQEYDPECSCRLTCTACNICIHKYICTCPDSSIKWNICKHAHALAKKLQGQTSVKEDDSVSYNDLTISENNKLMESNLILESLRTSTTQNSTNFLERREKYIEELVKSLRNIIGTDEDLRLAQNITKSIEPTVEAAKRKAKYSTENNEPANKKICLQRLYRTKKSSCTSTSTKSLSKPTAEEEESLTYELLSFQRKDCKEKN